MPNYKYKCYSCYVITDMFLPMSTDPEKLFCCQSCPDGTARRIIAFQPQVTGLKTFAGDWFKKTYGHELGEDGMTQLERRKDFEQAMEEHKRDNL